MTSTNFTVGMPENTRPSSRVLKPPGGVSTLVFSDPGYEQPNPYRHPNYRQHQNIDIVAGENNSHEVKPQEVVENSSETLTVGTDEQKPVEVAPKPVEEPVEEHVVLPRRGRVPPGGYSSGLW